MSRVLFKNTLRRMWMLAVGFTGILIMYQSIIISLIDPENMSEIQSLFSVAEGMLDVFGMDITAMTSPLAYTASTFFGMLALAFPMIYYCILNNSLIAKGVENTSIAYTLTAPIKRTTVVITQGLYLISSLVFIFIGVFISGVIMLATKDVTDFWSYANLCGITMVICIFVAVFSYLLTVVFCSSKLSLALGAGVPIAFILLNMISNVDESVGFLAKLTPFGYVDPVDVVMGDQSVLGLYIVFISLTVLCIAAAAKVFKNKNLAI